MSETKNPKRFFDRREPGPSYHYQEEMAISFNAAHKPGARIRVYPLARWLDDCHKETVVADIGAFVNAAGYAVVKIPGDCIALTHVEILPDQPVTETPQMDEAQLEGAEEQSTAKFRVRVKADGDLECVFIRIDRTGLGLGMPRSESMLITYEEAEALKIALMNETD